MQGLRHLALAAAAWFFVQSPQAAAQADSGNEETWRHTLVVYLLAPTIDGTVGIGPADGDVTLDPSDILSAFDAGFLGVYAAEKGHWGVMVDAVYMDLSEDFSGPADRASGELGLKQTILGLLGSYRLSDTWQLLFGANYVDLTNTLTVNGPIDQRRAKLGDSWVDPAVGLRWATPFGDGWSAGLMGTVGGFGVGSDFAWMATASISYAFSERWGITAGYRYLSFDYESGSGRDRFKFDASQSGPAVGVQIRF